MCIEKINQAHPHAENMRLYAEDAASNARPWELWQMAPDNGPWGDLSGHPGWNPAHDYRRKPKEPELIQGYTAEQWQFIIDRKFDCEFRDSVNSIGLHIGLLERMEDGLFSFRSSFGTSWKFCAPRRIKGVKQPWFGGECPVNGEVLAYLREGAIVYADAEYDWQHSGGKGDIIAFIEL